LVVVVREQAQRKAAMGQILNYPAHLLLRLLPLQAAAAAAQVTRQTLREMVKAVVLVEDQRLILA
jgi:hypothetical protein